MPGKEELSEVTVLGAGPSGLAIAWHLARRGVRVQVRAPRPLAPWPASYGVFERLLPDGYAQVIAHRYARPFWVNRRGTRLELGSPYVRLSTHGLQSLLLERCRAANVQFVTAAGPPAEGAEGLCIVATGRSPDSQSTTRYQSAYGIWTKLSVEWLARGEMIFMDLSGVDLASPPSFLYATREGDLHFLQETVLVSAERPSFARLRGRLEARLSALGLDLGEIIGEERCLIPTGGAPSPGRGNRIHFGARAGLTQPASGYSLAHSLRLAESLARAIDENRRSSPSRIAERGRDHLWSWERRLRFQFFDYGASVVAALDHELLGRFMETFLSSPPREIAEFVDGELSLSGTIKLMSKTFGRSDSQIRTRLLRLRTADPRTESRI